MAIFPGEFEEFGGAPGDSFLAEERFEAPLDVWTVPGLEAVASGRKPVEF